MLPLAYCTGNHVFGGIVPAAA